MIFLSRNPAGFAETLEKVYVHRFGSTWGERLHAYSAS
jgi:hypothetical protein